MSDIATISDDELRGTAERDQLLSMVRELAPEGIEQACDECGGDDAECPAECAYRRARAMLSGKRVVPATGEGDEAGQQGPIEP